MRVTCFIVVMALGAVPAQAQTAPASAAVLLTSHGPTAPAGVAGAVDRLLRAQLDSARPVRVREGVALDLEDAQLATGCMGETAECLAPIAAQIGVDVLVLPALESAGGELVLAILVFDRRDQSLRRVVRRAAGEVELLDSIDGAVRELFGLAAAAEAHRNPPDEPTPEDRSSRPMPSRPTRGPELALPLLITTAGALAVGAGAITGALALVESDAYRTSPPPQTEADAAALAGRLTTADALANTTNVLVIAGTVVALIGIGWTLVEVASSGGGSASAILQPMLAPGLAGLTLRGGLP